MTSIKKYTFGILLTLAFLVSTLIGVMSVQWNNHQGGHIHTASSTTLGPNGEPEDWDEYIPIYNWLDLVRIGRQRAAMDTDSSFTEYSADFALSPNGKYRLMNDIHLPYSGMNHPAERELLGVPEGGKILAGVTNIDTHAVTVNQGWYQGGYIGDYFRGPRVGASGNNAEDSFFGWFPVDFSGIIDGRDYENNTNFRITGVSGNRGGPRERAGNERLGYQGLFRVLTGKVRNIDIEANSTLALWQSRAGLGVPAWANTTGTVRLSAREMSYGLGVVASRTQDGAVIENVHVQTVGTGDAGRMQIKEGGAAAGGFVGTVNGNTTIRNSTSNVNLGHIAFSGNGNGSGHSGGLIGRINSGDVLIENVGITGGEIRGRWPGGLIMGIEASANVTIRNTYVGNTVFRIGHERNELNAGGFVAQNYSPNLRIENSFFYGTVTHQDSAGQNRPTLFVASNGNFSTQFNQGTLPTVVSADNMVNNYVVLANDAVDGGGNFTSDYEVRVATIVKRSTLQDQLFIDHFLNAEGNNTEGDLKKAYTMFDLNGSVDDARIGRLRLNPTPEVLADKTEIHTAGNIRTVGEVRIVSDDRVVNALELFFNMRREVKLLPGTYDLGVEFQGIEFPIHTVVVSPDGHPDDRINLFIIEYFNHENVQMIDGFVLVDEGTLIWNRPDGVPMIFRGWYTDFLGGKQVQEITLDAWDGELFMRLWARYDGVNRVIGQVTMDPGIITLTSNPELKIRIRNIPNLSLPEHERRPQVEFNVSFDHDGNFAYYYLDPDNYMLSIVRDGFVSHFYEFEIEELTAEIDAGTFHLVMVTMSLHIPAGATATITDDNGREVFRRPAGQTDAIVPFGTHSRALTDGNYMIFLTRDGHRTWSIDFSVLNGIISVAGETQNYIEMNPLSPVIISGTAREGSRIELIRNDIVVAYIDEVGADGLWSFVGVANAEYTVRSILEGFNTEEYEIEIIGGANVTDVEFAMTNALTIAGRARTNTTVQVMLTAVWCETEQDWVELEEAQLIGTTTTDMYGNYTFTVATNGVFKLIFTRENYLQDTRTVEIFGASNLEVQTSQPSRNTPTNVVVGYVVQGAVAVVILAMVGFSMFGFKYIINRRRI